MINRLLGMIYILMKQGTVTAAELAERFEVSARTIYRDMDTLSAAGIPIYAKKGKNGGICLTEQFVLDKMLITQEEQQKILSGLISLRETRAEGRRRSYLLTPEGRALLDQEYRRICRQAEDYRRCFEGSDQG